MENTNIIFVEDDPILGTVVTKGLSNSGMKVCHLNSLSNFKHILLDIHPDLLLLDLDIDGHKCIDEIEYARSVFSSMPIIIASSCVMGKEIKESLNAGANYYIKKPYELEELISVIQKLCNDSNKSQEYIYFSKYILKLSSHELFYNDTIIIQLNPKEFKLLHLLLSETGRICKRSELLTQVWGKDDASNESLSNYIKYLREYLKHDETIKIITVKGIGYRILY